MEQIQKENGNEQQRKGVKAEERPATSTSYVQTLNAYVTSYLPTSIKRKLPTIITPGTKFSAEERDVVLSASFGTLEIGSERRLCLLLTYTNGFQIWDVQTPQNVVEILSKREGAIKSVQFVANPDFVEKENTPLAGKRPLLAVLSAADPAAKFPNTMVKLYSLKENKYVNMLRFKSEVCNFLTSKRVFVVALADRLHGFDNVTIEKMFTLSCYPSPSSSPISLGSRWIAYPAAETAPSVPNQDGLGEMANKVKDWASSFYAYSKKTISDYVFSEDESAKQSTNPNQSNSTAVVSNPKMEEATGTIAVYDIVNQKTICHFKAHSHPISITRFDPSGTLLATASIEGHVINVFLLNTNPSGSVHYNYQHLYKLQRGYTNATLQEISFNIDSKWVNVTSSRGTTHIFAINRTGGTPNIYTHLREFRTKSDAVPIPFTNVKTITLSPHCRIHQTPVVDDYLGKNQISSNATSVFFGSPLETEYLYVMNQSGVLTQYTMKSHRPTSPPNRTLSPKPQFQYPYIMVEDLLNTQNRPLWREFPPKDPSICTHSIPQLHFQTDYPTISPFLSLQDAELLSKKKEEKQIQQQQQQIKPNPILNSQQTTFTTPLFQSTQPTPIQNKEQKKSGWCECCYVKFDNITEHLMSIKHQQFTNNDMNFAQLDYLLSQVNQQNNSNSYINLNNNNSNNNNSNNNNMNVNVNSKEELMSQ